MESEMPDLACEWEIVEEGDKAVVELVYKVRVEIEPQDDGWMPHDPIIYSKFLLKDMVEDYGDRRHRRGIGMTFEPVSARVLDKS